MFRSLSPGCASERIADDGHDPPTWLLAERLMAESIGGIILPSLP